MQGEGAYLGARCSTKYALEKNFTPPILQRALYGSSKLSKQEWKLKISGRGGGPRKTFGNDNNLTFDTSKESLFVSYFGETKFESGLAV